MSIVKKVTDDGRKEYYLDTETGRYTCFSTDEDGVEHVFGDESVAKRYWERRVLRPVASMSKTR